MLYYEFQNDRLSRLGFGAMRLPVIDGQQGNIDEDALQKMVDCAFEQGINYFDTAYSYHAAQSEGALSRALAAHPRESYFLADKFPGHETRSVYKPAEIFQEQLDRCGVDYFDYYLLHNVTELSIDTYLDPRWQIVEYLLEQKKAGRIRHLGFSTHGRLDTIQRFMQAYGEHMEFCQLQLNYLDWHLQDAETKYNYLASCGIPVWVMEPLRGGKLVSFDEQTEQHMQSMRQDEPLAWAFRWLQRLSNVGVTLSGMGSVAMIEQNAAIFSEHKPLDDEAARFIEGVGDKLADSIPCTACGYCLPHCPVGLNIPNLISHASDARFALTYTVRMGIDALPEDKRPSACIGCGSCTDVCPQHIDVPSVLSELSTKAESLLPWAELRKYD